MLHDDCDIDDEELLPLTLIHCTNLHVSLAYSSYDFLNMFGMREDEFDAEFRFEEHIFKLAATLQLPGTFKCQSAVVVDSFEGLCIPLKNLNIHVDILI